MAIALVGQKIGMTRLMADDGSASSVSVIKIEPNRVVQTKSLKQMVTMQFKLRLERKLIKKAKQKLVASVAH